MIGRANVPLRRFLSPAYQSGTLPRGGLVDSSLPSARAVRKVLEFISNLIYVSLDIFFSKPKVHIGQTSKMRQKCQILMEL